MVGPAMRWLRGKSKCRRRPLLPPSSSLFFLSACFSLIPAPALKWTRRRKMWRRRKKTKRSPPGAARPEFPFTCGRAQRRPPPSFPRHRVCFAPQTKAEPGAAADLLVPRGNDAFRHSGQALEKPSVFAGACAQTFLRRPCKLCLFTNLLKETILLLEKPASGRFHNYSRPLQSLTQRGSAQMRLFGRYCIVWIYS